MTTSAKPAAALEVPLADDAAAVKDDRGASNAATNKINTVNGIVVGPSTLAVHAGEDRQKLGNSITDPIFCASTYTFADTQSVIDFIEQKQPREEYGRYGNPSEKVVERKLAALEGGESALLFSTGMSAIVGLLMAKLNSGDEVVFFDECYHRSREFCTQAPVALRRGHAAGAGLRLRRDGSGDHAAHEAADQRIADQSALERRRSGAVRRHRPPARRRDADRCHARHALQHSPARRRHRLRAALGHQVSGRAQRSAGRRDRRHGRKARSRSASCAASWAAINSPHNIYLLARGLKTFELRMQRHNENGLAVAEFLAGHPRIEKVYYPGLPIASVSRSRQAHDARLRRAGDVSGAATPIGGKRPRVVDACEFRASRRAWAASNR